MNIVGIGANVHDTLIRLSDFPVEDTKMPVDAVVPSGGGPCATGLVAAAQLGAKTAWLGQLSDDTAGTFLLDDFRRFGVSTDFIGIKPGYSTFSATVLLNEKNGSRTCLLSRGNLPPLELNGRQLDAIAASQILMVDGNELNAAVAGAHYARKHGTKVLYDAGGLYPDVEQLLAETDLLIPSEEFALKFTGKSTAEDSARELFKQFRPDVVVITRGSRGGIICLENTLETYPAFDVEVVDSNGAGDVFHGAFAFAFTCGMPFMECCRFASAAAALKCTKIGARNSAPSYEQVRCFLKN
ncbi:MAG: carbohydrate kinase family protein [Planctomycetaceae bacterium]|nr:carbohydrate kinase family protein [Planctomycetaceae bacterium]